MGYHWKKTLQANCMFLPQSAHLCSYNTKAAVVEYSQKALFTCCLPKHASSQHLLRPEKHRTTGFSLPYCFKANQHQCNSNTTGLCRGLGLSPVAKAAARFGMTPQPAKPVPRRSTQPDTQQTWWNGPWPGTALPSPPAAPSSGRCWTPLPAAVALLDRFPHPAAAVREGGRRGKDHKHAGITRLIFLVPARLLGKNWWRSLLIWLKARYFATLPFILVPKATLTQKESLLW